MKTEFERKSLYKEAFALLERANKLLRGAHIKHEQSCSNDKKVA